MVEHQKGEQQTQAEDNTHTDMLLNKLVLLTPSTR